MILAEQAHLRIASATHPGLKRKLNEDRYSVTAYRLSADKETPSVLAILADGIGGHRGGEVAAQLAVENVNKYVANSPSDKPAQVLKQALDHTNQLILNFSSANPSLAGMGTTCVCAWIIGMQLYAASVGDSRLYLQRMDKLLCLTTDHTWIQQALTQGTLTPEQAKSHPNAHVIHRFLGSKRNISPDLRMRLNLAEDDLQAEANQGLQLLPQDHLLLCSDGLTGLVTDAEILDILCKEDINKAPNKLIDLANQRGGPDNITVVVMEVPRQDLVAHPGRIKPSSVSTRNNRYRSPISRWMVGMLAIAILAMVLLLIFLTFR